jgi:hypothetical protein
MYGDEKKPFKSYYALVNDIINVIDKNYKVSLNNLENESIFDNLCFIYDSIKNYINF